MQSEDFLSGIGQELFTQVSSYNSETATIIKFENQVSS